MRRNKLVFIRKIIYKLKRSYGLPIDYFQLSNHSMDPEDGDKETSYSLTTIRKAVVLRAREFRSFVYDLAYISANKDFTHGGFFDPEDRRVIIDSSDLPVGFTPKVDDYFMFQDSKYEVKEVFHFEDNYAYILLARKLRGAPIVRIMSASSALILSQESDTSTESNLTQNVVNTLSLTHVLKEVP